jgi:hypothetical protein
MDAEPMFTQTTSAPLANIQGCVTRATGDENVNYLPTASGGMFKSTAGPQEYVFWLLSIDDLAAERRVTVHAVNRGVGQKLVTKIQSCL